MGAFRLREISEARVVIMPDLKDIKKKLISKAKELLNDEVKKLENDRADQMKDRIKPLPESSGMDEEQLKQLSANSTPPLTRPMNKDMTPNTRLKSTTKK